MPLQQILIWWYLHEKEWRQTFIFQHEIFRVFFNNLNCWRSIRQLHMHLFFVQHLHNCVFHGVFLFGVRGQHQSFQISFEDSMTTTGSFSETLKFKSLRNQVEYDFLTKSEQLRLYSTPSLFFGQNFFNSRLLTYFIITFSSRINSILPLRPHSLL